MRRPDFRVTAHRTRALQRVYRLDFIISSFIFALGFNSICWEINEMTKFVKIVSVLTLVVALAACTSGRAQNESVVNGDATFSSAQSK